MSRFDSVIVSEEWISEHYLTSDAGSGTFAARVRALQKEWKESEDANKVTPRSGLRSHVTDIARRIAEIGDDLPALAKTEVRSLHALQREALGLDREVSTWASERSGSAVEVPDVVAHPTPTGTSMLILEAQPADSVEDVLNGSDDGKGRLLSPAVIDGKPEAATAKAVSTIFLTGDAPPFVLVQAGPWALLAERTRWPEGRWLAVDLGLVAERRDIKRGGEIDYVAALLGRDTLLPGDDGTALWTTILDESVQHTVGVSKDLREGIRLSVEIIANEVVQRRRERGLPVEGEDGLADDLSRQALRFLYRILFLLYAEADPELGVLPSRTTEYEQGYGLGRLRELIHVELTSEGARHGTHLFDSLRKLFDLVDQGHKSEDVPFHPLRADLFQREATRLIVEVKLGNEALQQVLQHLLLSKEKSGRDRGFISYAELGINQLGAVYEGLMSYTGFIADTDLYEVAPNGDATKGTWVVPVERARDIAAKDVVTAEDPATGEPRPVVHRKGTFVYRLASRERQQSASYYTPEVLTRSVVKHSLAELLDQDAEKTPALDILNMTVCEPALGSGAFAIEAVRQLADAYLERRQEELGEQIPSENVPKERQKVKAYLALHQVYGVDLNATAVELAEVSIWLDTMQAGLQAPWFGLHLRRGNSLIGARRAVYSPTKHFARKAWLKAVPRDVPLHDSDAEVADGIHHFLLPAEGWGAVQATAEAKEYAPEARERLREWRRAVLSNPTKKDRDRLARLAQRVETLWDFSRRRLEIAEAEIRRHIEVWGAGDALPEATGAVTREQIEQVLHDENGAYRRLRRVMDAWSALWSWPLTKRTVPGTDEPITPPTWDSWLGGLEAILGVQPKETDRDRKGQVAFTTDLDWHGLNGAEQLDRGFTSTLPIDLAKKNYPWLHVAEQIAMEQGFFHWELDFAPVFARGGFDLQVGNPPWVRPFWDESAALAEFDPWWQLTAKPAEQVKRERRERTLALRGAVDAFLDERAAQVGINEHLGSAVDRPVLRGLNPDLYRCFMERTWRSMVSSGIVGLIHPESHFTEARANGLRKETYPRLRRHWAFKNNMYVFSEISDKRDFGLHIYSYPTAVSFLQAGWIYDPAVIDRSIVHDGSGDAPGVRDSEDRWDLRPHAQRIVRVDEAVLSRWAALIDEPGTAAHEARMLYPVNRASVDVLNKIALAPRFGSLDFAWTRGWEEDQDRKAGYFESRSAVPSTWNDVILQGPHLTVATPLYQQPNERAKSRQDTSLLDLEGMTADFIPRTNYQRAKPYPEYIAEYPKWHERPSTEFFRLAWRRMADSATVRTLQPVIVSPGPTHVHLVITASVGSSTDLVVAAGTWASLPVDFFVKAAGQSELNQAFVRRIPHVRHHALEQQLILRTLRLNCLTQPYALLWAELYDRAWHSDAWAPGVGLDPVVNTDKPALGDVEAAWSWDTPLRRDADRRQALVEIDAIVAVMLDITADELVTIYRTQFPVLQKYERGALYNAHGRQVPRELAKEYRKRDGNVPPEALTVEGKTYALPFLTVDREKDYRAAHERFSRLVRERSS